MLILACSGSVCWISNIIPLLFNGIYTLLMFDLMSSIWVFTWGPMGKYWRLYKINLCAAFGAKIKWTWPHQKSRGESPYNPRLNLQTTCNYFHIWNNSNADNGVNITDTHSFPTGETNPWSQSKPGQIQDTLEISLFSPTENLICLLIPGDQRRILSSVCIYI